MNFHDMLMIIIYIIITVASLEIIDVIVDFINTQIDKVQANTEIAKYSQLNKYIDSAQEVIRTAVLTVSQTYVDSLKKSGNFDKEAQKTAKNKAVTIVKNLMTQDVVKAIQTLHNDADIYIDNAIEEMCKLLKTQNVI